MARKPQAPHAPATAALTRLAQLAQQAGPGRMEREVQGVIAAWSAEFGQAETRALVGVLRDHLIVGAAEHAEQVQDIDRSDAAAVRQTERSLAALEAARDTLVTAYEALVMAEELGAR